MPYPGQSGRHRTGGYGKSVAPAGVDPWLKTELRLAERQGLLTGRHLSPVQVQGIQILRLLDEVDRQQARFDLLRTALVAAGAPPKGLWPEFKELFGDVTVEMDDPAASDPNATYDYRDVEWKGISDAKQEYEDLMAKVSALHKGRISGEALTK